jgi:hypothetical protein
MSATTDKHISTRVKRLSVSALAAGLAACGAGGDAAVKPAPQSAAVRADAAYGGDIEIEGQSQSVQAAHGMLRVMMPPPSWPAGGAYPERRSFSWGEFAASAPIEAAPGAYGALPNSPDTVVRLVKGVVTDLAGNGQFAIGRWTRGEDSDGGSYNANQGRAWAVGTPIEADLAAREIRRCDLVAATRPTAGDGRTPPGVLSGADALMKVELDRVSRETRANYTLHLRYSIGGDLDQRFTGKSAIGSLTSSGMTHSTLMSRLVGTDPRSPYMVVAFGVEAPHAGVVNGMAVLYCPAPGTAPVKPAAT